MLDGKKVGCGTTGPGGNNNPRSERPSVAPLAFLRAMWKAGARDFDAYDHHPYYSSRFDTPSTRSEVPSRIMLGNIDRLVRQLTRLYGRKPVWISEYGFQTNPPDRGIFGVPWALQARHLREAYAIARLHPRIDMMLWFLIRDERRVDGWQSGLMTASGKRKPAFGAFRRLPRCDRHPDLGPLAPPKGRRGPPARADSFAGATLENDVLNGSPGADRISGLLGQDILSGLEGTDCLDGGEDRDDLAGGRGADILFGGEGDDILSGGPGDDMLGGGPGDDRLDGGPGRNTYSGDDGDDFIDAANGAVDTVACGRGTDAVLADASDSILGCERVKRLRRAPR